MAQCCKVSKREGKKKKGKIRRGIKKGGGGKGEEGLCEHNKKKTQFLISGCRILFFKPLICI